MNIKLKKGSLETLLVFLLSPFLSIPLIILQLKRNDKIGTSLLSILVGLIAFLYIPAISNDKARYFERYTNYQSFSFSQFSQFQIGLQKPDFVFDFIIFFCSKLPIRLEFAFLILTWLCVFLLFKIVNTIIEHLKITNYNYLHIALLVIFSFSLPSLFSGLRFTLGACFLVYGFFALIFERKKAKGLLFIFLATQTHFSLLFFVPAIFLFMLDRTNRINYRLLFLISFVFLMIPSTIISQVFSSVALSESLDAKTSVYVAGDDFVSQNFDTDDGSLIIYIFRTLWYYVVLLILLLNNKRLIFDAWSKYFINFLYCLIFFVNFTYSFTTIFSRYTIVIRLFFLLYIVYQYLNKKSIWSKKIFYLIMGFYLLAFLVDIYVLRINFSNSLFSKDSLTFFQILLKKMTPYEFIK